MSATIDTIVPPFLPRLLVRLVVLGLLVTGLSGLPAGADAAGRSFWVAPTGDDAGAGTQDDPWGTIYFGMEQLRAGDTLYLRGGTYTERIGTLRPLPKGTPDARITVRNQPGERPVIKGLLNIFKGGAHYWTFDGLEITWDPATGGRNEAMIRMVDGVGWEIRNSEIHGNRSYAAIRVFAETPGLATDWAIRDSCIHTTVPSNAQNNDHNIYVGADSRGATAAGPGVIERNVIFGAPNGSNIKLGAGEPSLPGTTGVTIRNNVLAGAPHNVLIAWKSHGNAVHHNLMLQQDNGTWSEDWYPNIRGLQMTGTNNAAWANGGFGGGSVITGHDSTTAIADRGGNVELPSPGVADTTSCDGLRQLRGASRAFGPEGFVDRIAGNSRVATSVALAAAAFPGGSTTAVLTRSDAYADALAGAPLAGHLDAPVLLTDKDALSTTTAAELRRLGVSTAYLMGGTAALSRQVESDLADLGITAVRLSGANRFATAAAVAAELPPTDVAYVVEGSNPDPRRGWPDAVAASALTAATRTPVLLTLRDDLPDASRRALQALAPREIRIVGGPGAVGADVEAALRDLDGDGRDDTTVTRISGDTRYETSAAVARKGVAAGADPDHVWLVTGANWPDALAAGPAAAKAGATLLLVDPTDARRSPPVLDWLGDRPDPAALDVVVVGGPGAVGYGTEATLAFGLD